MLIVSNNFLTLAKSTVRKPHCKIEVLWTDTESNIDNIIVNSNSVNYHHNNILTEVNLNKQVVNSNVFTSKKYCLLDGSFILNGEYYAAPSTQQEAITNEIGFYSAEVSDVNGEFTEDVILTVLFNKRSISNLRIVGDTTRGEYPVDFTINLYEEDELLYSNIVTNNDKVIYEKVLNSIINDCDKMELIISKWNKANTVAKIIEFYPIEKDVFIDDDILSVNITKEIESQDNTLLKGIITSEVNIELQNIAYKKNDIVYKEPFSYENEESPFRNFLTQGRKVDLYLGFSSWGISEFVKIGTYWTANWSCKDTSVSVNCRDRLEFLRNSFYKCSSVLHNTNAYDIFESILEDAKINIPLPSLVYDIDDDLQNIVVSNFWYDKDSYFNVLNTLTEAFNCFVYVDANDVIRIVKKDNIAEDSSLTIDRDLIFDKTHTITTDTRNKIEVEVKTLAAIEEEKIFEDTFDINANEIKTFTINYNKQPAENIAINITEENGVDIDILEEKKYVWGAEIKVRNNNNNSGNFVLEAVGTSYEYKKTDTIVVKDDDDIQKKGIREYKYPSNLFIQNEQLAQEIATYILNNYKTEKRKISINWRGNPTLELLDVVDIEVYKNKYKKYFINRLELTYDGSLVSTLEGIER